VPALGTPLGDQLPGLNQSLELLPAVQTDWAIDAVGIPMTVSAVKASNQARRCIMNNFQLHSVIKSNIPGSIVHQPKG
jgi:hypothetical protein